MSYRVLLVCVLLTGVTRGGGSAVNYVKNVFIDTTINGHIHHLTMHETNGVIYAGGVNSVYELSENLEQQNHVVTGPFDDSPNCRPNEECPCHSSNADACVDYTRVQTNSVSKALVIDYDAGRLITCSNLRQGHCEKRHLANISLTDTSIFRPVVNYDLVSPVVMYIAPGLTDEHGRNSKVLYVAATYSTVGLTGFAEMVWSLSSRNLSTFDIVYDDLLLDGSYLTMQSEYTDNFRIHYKTGFYSGGFSYFLAIQPDSYAGNADVRNITKIMRVCGNDKMYRSYVELPLKCTHNGVDYDVLQDADVIRPGSKLAQSLSLSHLDQSHVDDVIFAVFTRQQSHQVQAGQQSPESVMCLYTLRDVRMKFTAAIQNCFKGQGNTGPSHFKPIVPCTTLVSVILILHVQASILHLHVQHFSVCYTMPFM